MRVCDRCHKENAEYELTVTKTDTFSKFVRAVEAAIVWKPEPIERVDLCPECYSLFKNLLTENKHAQT